MAHQKSLSIYQVFDEDEGKTMPLHQYAVGTFVKSLASAPSQGREGVIEKLVSWNEQGIPRYWVRFGLSYHETVLESEVAIAQ